TSIFCFFFSSRRRHTRSKRDWSSDVCSSDLTHLTGFRAALTRTINEWAKKDGILKKEEFTLTGDDIREGLTAVLHVKVKDPQFEGQTKTKLGNSEVEGIVKTVVNDVLGDFFDKSPSVARTIIAKAVSAARAREAARKARELVRKR